MKDILETQSARFGGLITAQALGEAGLNSHSIQTLVSRGELVRIRRGIFVLGAQWQAATYDDRYRLFVRATAAIAKAPLVLSHQSAAALHGLPIIGPWPRAVHTIAPDATGGSTARFTTSHRNVCDPDTIQIGGLTATSLSRTLVDVAASSTFLVGVTMIDHALRVDRERVAEEARRGVAGEPALTSEVLYEELAAVNPRTGLKKAERVIGFATPLAADPGESLSRVRMFQLGFEVPELQVLFMIDGHEYWVDFYWRRVRKIGEFDGLLKYSRGAVLGDRDPADVVITEKLREDKLRFHSDSFARWTWDIAISAQRFHAFLTEHDVPRGRSGSWAQSGWPQTEGAGATRRRARGRVSTGQFWVRPRPVDNFGRNRGNWGASIAWAC